MQYLKVDEKGAIIRAEDFEESSDNIPIEYKKSWGVDIILQRPYWSFEGNKWCEDIYGLDFISELREERIDYLGLICKEKIIQGFSFKINEDVFHFSYDREAQANLSERWQLFQNDMISSIRITAHDHEEKSVRLSLNKQDFNDLYIASVQHKEDCIGHFRDELIPLVNQALTMEAINAITWETEAVFPTPSPLVLKDDNTIDKQINQFKMDQAEGSAEMVDLIMAMMMGGI